MHSRFRFFFAPCSRAQRYFFARYTQKDGLIINRARFLYQDSKGRLYISTFGGLSVYDGSRFLNYTTENGLATSLVNDVVEMGDDSLWIIPNGAALHCMVHGIIRNITTADHFYPVINQMIKCQDGYYYAIADQGLFRLEKNRFVKIDLKDASGNDAAGYFTKAIECNRQLLILTDPQLGGYPGPASLLIYDLDSRKILVPEEPKTLSGNPVSCYFLTRSPLNDILVATGTGVRKIDPLALRQNSIHLVDLPPPYQAANHLSASYLFFDNLQNLWLAVGKEILLIDHQGIKHSFTTGNGLPEGIYNSIFQDRENNIWFTKEQNGIVRLVSREIKFYTQPDSGFTVTDLSAVCTSDSVWFYDFYRHNLMVFAGNRQKIIHGVGAFPSYGHIIVGKNAYLLSANKIYGLHFLPGQRFRASLLFQDTSNLDGNTCFDHDNNLVVSSFKLTFIRAGRIAQYPLSYLADQASIDTHNRIWTITRSDELSVFTTDAARSDPRGSDTPGSDTPCLHLLATWSKKEQPAISPRSIAVDSGGRVWIGTRDHGLYCLFFDGLRLVSWTQLTMKNGLSENFIRFLHCDSDNTIWACTPSGLDKIRLDHGQFSIGNITPGKDMDQNILKVLPSGNGSHWALGSGGYMKIARPEEAKNSFQPHILFSKVIVGNEPVARSPGHELSLAYDRNAISFYVGAPTFKDENQTRFSYLLDGSDDPEWSIPSDQSAIHFVNLPPGKYRLKVKAQFLTGYYPDLEAAYSFIIEPPWWQTVWCRIGFFAALTGIAVWSIRSYIRRRLEIQRIALEGQQAVEKERTRIATDMHDDLGSGLSRIKFLSETIGIKKQQQLPFEDEITGIRDYSHEMIDKMGEIVWALNEKNDSLNDLMSYTRSYAVEYLLQAGICCKVEEPDDIPSRFVSGEFRRNVYLTIKEALHNVVKHARAEQVCIRVEIRQLLTIVIQDDGIGFDKNNIRPFSNGLQNMHKRIKDIGGTLQILPASETAGTTGTTVRLSVPL